MEFRYKKGKIIYFDLNIEGDILYRVDSKKIIFNIKLTGFKDRLFIIVIMVMYKN